MSQQIDSAVAKFLSASPLKAFVGGEWIDSSDSTTISVIDPGAGMVIVDVADLTPTDIDRAVAAAEQAFHAPEWSSLTQNERAIMLHRLTDAVEAEKDVLAQIESLDAGKILAQAAGDVQNFIDTMRYFIEISQNRPLRTPLAVARHEAVTMRFPWGPCGFIFPWNFPFLLIGWNIAPALAAGNTIVIKPAEDTPLSALYLAKIAQEVGLPKGVINVVTGRGETAGATLAAHPGLKRVAFTGSPEVGRMVASVCGQNLTPVKLELGGKGAAVLMDDVDVERTADSLVRAITFHAGQVCCNATRWIVQSSIYDHFMDACIARLESIQVGYQLDPASQMGPVVNRKQYDRILRYIELGRVEGAEILLQGGHAEVAGRQGFYVKPALMSGCMQNVAAREEIFGPVAFVSSFDDEQQAIELANSTDYGLANSVWSQDLTRAHRLAERLVAGNCWINAHNVFVHGVPYGGINKSGLGGGVLSIETYFDYTRTMSVVQPHDLS